MTAQLAHTLSQLHPVDDSRLRIQGHVQDARKLRLARVAPAVIGAAHDRHVAALHEALLPALELELDFALDADANVERDGAVPDVLRHVGVVVDVADDGAAGDHKRGLVDEVVLVGGEVGVLGERGGEGGE